MPDGVTSRRQRYNKESNNGYHTDPPDNALANVRHQLMVREAQARAERERDSAKH
jgi:hypothetical protein